MIWTEEREAAALAFCRRFEGTPHMQRRLIAGRGADCVRFVIGAIQAAGILPPFRWPPYSQGIGFNQRVNWLAGCFLEHLHSRSIAIQDWTPLTGDIGIFKVGRVSNHVGIVVGSRFWHVTTSKAVHHCQIITIEHSLQEVIRIEAEGLKSQPIDVIAK